MQNRNASILQDKRSGMSAIDIAKKYGITRARVYQICRNDSKKDERKSTELWKRLCDAADNLGGYDEPQISRAYNVIMRARKTIPNTWPIKYVTFEQIPRDEWPEIRNCGQKTLKLLYAAFPE